MRGEQVRRIQLGALGVVAALVQIGLHLTYRPCLCGDSPGYITPAAVMYGSGFTHYWGERTPGYPLFLLACEMVTPVRVSMYLNPLAGEVVTWVQSVFGVASVILLYLTMERLEIRSRVGFPIALLVALLVGVSEPTMLILPEALCAFLMTLTLYLAARTVDRMRRGQPTDSFALAAGFALGAAILVRPNLLFTWVLFAGAIPALIGLRMWWRRPFDAAGAVAKIARPCLAGGALLLVAWLLPNYERTGYLTLSMMIDLTRTSAAYNLFDRVQPQDKVVGEIMDRTYRESAKNGKTDHDYIWLAYDEIMRRSHEMPLRIPPGGEDRREFVIYRYLGDVSNGLLWESPRVWAENSLADFWRTFDFRFDLPAPGLTDDPTTLTKIKQPVLIHEQGGEILALLNRWQSPLILALYLLTFVAVGITLPLVWMAPDLKTAAAPLVILIFATSAIVGMVSPCILATYYPRFSVPLISSFALCSAYVLERALGRGKVRKVCLPL